MAKNQGYPKFKIHSTILLSVLVICFITSNKAFSQFSPKTIVPELKTQADTTVVSPITTGRLNLQVYNDAYDAYLRKLRFRQRNTIIIDPLSGLTFSQTSFGNWAAGGSNSVSIRTNLRIQHVYAANAFSTTTTLAATYAFVNIDKKVRKSEDVLRFTVSPQWRIAPKWQLTSQAELLTQFSNTYKAPGDTVLTSGFMSPGTLTASLGVTYAPPKKIITIFLSPLTGKLLTVINQELADRPIAGIEKGRRFQADFGARLEVRVAADLYKKKLAFSTHFISMWDYSHTPNMDWTTRINYKFNALFGCNLYVRALYDEKVQTPDYLSRKFLQINQSFGFGVTYGFTSRKPPTPVHNPYTKPRLRGRSR